MAVDKLVDSTQLDTDLTSVANAIRTKGGTSASLAFPAGFVSAIDAIPTGGGGGQSLDDFLAEKITAFRITNPDITNTRTKLNNYYKEATLFINRYLGGQNGLFTSSWFTSIVFIPTSDLPTGNNFNNNNPYLTICDFGSTTTGIGNNAFNGNSNLKTLILRRTSIVSCSNSSFTGTPAASGGSGMTIYIPQVLYDHLGDGTSNDYKSATNWSTWNGYGKITWAKIEGSQYENYYADGTPIT